MNYAAFTNDSLTLMYEAIRGALAADDAAEKHGGDPRFIRETADWKRHAADLEVEMIKAERYLRSSTGTKGNKPSASLIDSSQRSDGRTQRPISRNDLIWSLASRDAAHAIPATWRCKRQRQGAVPGSSFGSIPRWAVAHQAGRRRARFFARPEKGAPVEFTEGDRVE